MDINKHKYFPLNDKILKENFYTLNDEKNITNELKKLSDNIILHVKKENEQFVNSVNTKMNEYLLENKDILIQLINSIYILLSEKLLEKLSNLYDIGFNNCLNRIDNETQYNIYLTENYYKGLTTIISDNNKIKELIEEFDPVDKTLYSDMVPHGENDKYTWSYTNFSDQISATKKTQNYLKKHYEFKKKLEESYDYLDNKLFRDLLNKYKIVINKIKEILQSIKDNKMNYIPNYIQLDLIDELYIRLDKYFSDDIFNKKYFQKYIILNQIKLQK